ncbi:DUF2141 domain-containing protein [Sphingomonas bacterium]|uniref:DUF2141 domain-containing protein n=1 Tax=Sphingomonas bacterium TaxID=1895847 RepID=UPI001576EE2B|nr:DUF2141 domain-containing protein [Sphingomonas bacterium]
MLKPLILLAAPVALVAAAAPVPDGNIVTIRVTNVRNAKGRLHVDLCLQATFLKDGCPLSASAPAQTPVTVLVVKNVPAGHYAAQLFHDENSNDKMDRGLFGIPKEGVAFSRDALKAMSAPKWTDAEFGFAGGAQAIQVKMHYYLGGSGPQAR